MSGRDLAASRRPRATWRTPAYQRPRPPQLMQTPEPLQVLQLDSPDPRKRPVPLHVLHRPEPRHGEQTELAPDAVPPPSYPPPELAHPDRTRTTDKPTMTARIEVTSTAQQAHSSMLWCLFSTRGGQVRSW